MLSVGIDSSNESILSVSRIRQLTCPRAHLLRSRRVITMIEAVKQVIRYINDLKGLSVVKAITLTDKEFDEINFLVKHAGISPETLSVCNTDDNCEDSQVWLVRFLETQNMIGDFFIILDGMPSVKTSEPIWVHVEISSFDWVFEIWPSALGITLVSIDIESLYEIIWNESKYEARFSQKELIRQRLENYPYNPHLGPYLVSKYRKMKIVGSSFRDIYFDIVSNYGPSNYTKLFQDIFELPYLDTMRELSLARKSYVSKKLIPQYNNMMRKKYSHEQIVKMVNTENWLSYEERTFLIQEVLGVSKDEARALALEP